MARTNNRGKTVPSKEKDAQTIEKSEGYYTPNSDFDKKTKESKPSENISRLHKSPIGTQGMALTEYVLDAEKPFDLTFGQKIYTYERMGRDDAVATCLLLNQQLISKAFSEFTVGYNTKSNKSKEAAKFVDWCLRNMTYQTMRQFAITASTFKQYGFSVIEKCYTKVRTGKYQGKWRIDKLAERPQLSLAVGTPFEYTDGGRRISNILQNPAFVMNTPTGGIPAIPPIQNSGFIQIPRNKCMIMGYCATDTNPMGVSPLDRCYTVWYQKNLISEYELIGVTKDLSGTIIARLPREILEEAAIDPNSKSALIVSSLQADLANMHAGDQNSTMLPSNTYNVNGSGEKEFDLELMKSGGGKQFNTAELIEQRRKAIFQIFGAQNVTIGESGSGGSYALMEGQSNINSHYVNHDITIIKEQIDMDLIPQLLALNEIYLDPEDMPVFVPSEITPLSSDEASKLVQRVLAVNGLVKTKENIIAIHQMLGLDTVHMESMTLEQLLEAMLPNAPMQSRSGDGMASGLNSGTSNVSTGDTSVGNLENA